MVLWVRLVTPNHRTDVKPHNSHLTSVNVFLSVYISIIMSSFVISDMFKIYLLHSVTYPYIHLVCASRTTPCPSQYCDLFTPSNWQCIQFRGVLLSITVLFIVHLIKLATHLVLRCSLLFNICHPDLLSMVICSPLQTGNALSLEVFSCLSQYR